MESGDRAIDFEGQLGGWEGTIMLLSFEIPKDVYVFCRILRSSISLQNFSLCAYTPYVAFPPLHRRDMNRYVQ